MKLYNKITSAFMLIAAVLGFASCSTSEDYTPAEKLTTAQVYFPNTLPAKQEIGKDASSFTIPLYRIITSGSLTVKLKAESASDVFTIPESVTFADGANKTDINISYDGSVLEYDDFSSVSLKISDDTYTTPYGASAYEFEVGVPAPWELIGEATFMETAGGWMGEQFTTKCKCYHNTVNTNQYKIEKPYLDYLGDYTNGNGTDLVFTVLKKGDKVGDITITKDNLVDFEPCNVGYTSNSCDLWLYPITAWSGITEDDIHNYVSEKDENGDPAIVVLSPYYWLPDYNGGKGAGWDYSSDECVKIALPGTTFADYSLEATYNGRYTTTDNSDFAVVYVNKGADINSVDVALIPGSDEDAASEAMINKTAANMITVTESQSVQLLFEESGKYVLAVAGYDANGILRKVDTQVIKVTSSKDGAETWTAVGTGTYNYNAFWTSGSTENLVLYQSNSDANRYKIADWCDTGEAGADLIFNWNKETNRLTMDEPCYTGYSDEYGKVYMSNMIAFGQDYDDYYQSTYDPETKTFKFVAVYWYDAYADYPYYNKNYTPETFVLDTSAAAKAKAQKLAKKSTKRHTNANRATRKPMIFKYGLK